MSSLRVAFEELLFGGIEDAKKGDAEGFQG
jgi:hypothetical protein